MKFRNNHVTLKNNYNVYINSIFFQTIFRGILLNLLLWNFIEFIIVVDIIISSANIVHDLTFRYNEQIKKLVNQNIWFFSVSNLTTF